MRDHVLHSLRSLAAYVESESAWREIRALRGDAALSARLGIWQVQRVVGRYGFERVPTEVSIPRRLHALGESFTLWSLTRAFNPAALGRQPFLREHHELWLSRTVLLGRYGRGQRRAATELAQPDEA